MYLLIIFLPLFSCITCGFFGRYIGKRGAALIAPITISITALLSWKIFYDVALLQSPCYITLAPWIHSGLLEVNWGFLFDSVTAVMLIVVTTVSAFVHIYSIDYMSHDPHLPRFMSYLSMFTFFMLILVTGDNFLQMFVGWEGVGLCSYLLINFWYTRIQANKAAIKAMVVNRVGDFGLILGIMAIYYVYRSIDFATVFATTPFFTKTTISILETEYNALNLICLLLFVGSVGKSAQLGLHTWLPDAMEGPTPVSALIHAATMVTAGVFLIVRCSPLFEFAPTALVVVTLVGAFTSFFAATTGVVQNDLKRVIAYSTCSQLGYMIFACGISNYSAGMFHLMNHAFFKALLFLGAGSVIHALGDEQDMRKMGGLANLLPYTYTMMLVGSLSLIGFPFMTGYYSKDMILELSYASYSISSNVAYWLGSISVFFTSFYSFRLIYLTFYARTNAFKRSIMNIHEAPIFMAVPLFILGLGSIFVGYLFRDMIVGMGTHFWGNAIYIRPENNVLTDYEFINLNMKLLPTVFSLGGAGIALLFYNNIHSGIIHYQMYNKNFRTIYLFLIKKWLFDKVYNSIIANSFLHIGYKITFQTLDKGIIPLFGPYGIVKVFQKMMKQASRFQSGYIYHYAFVMLVALTFTILLTKLYIWFNISSDIKPYLMFIVLVLFHNTYIKDRSEDVIQRWSQNIVDYKIESLEIFKIIKKTMKINLSKYYKI